MTSKQDAMQSNNEQCALHSFIPIQETLVDNGVAT